MKILDGYLPQNEVNALNNLHIEYAKVHWIGAKSESKNSLTNLIHSTRKYLSEEALGATAWYNVRPIDPVWHNDILSYCDKYPTDLLPEYTFIYYMRSPNSGGHLEFGGYNGCGDYAENSKIRKTSWTIEKTVEPIENRLVYFDATLSHRVQAYEGNRVSIGMVWWKITPDRYEEQKIDEYRVLERVWR